MMESNEEKPLTKTSLLDRWLNRKKDNVSSRDIPKRPDRIAPLSLGQQRLWFLQQLFPQNPFYHYCDYYRLEGSLDFSKLLEAMRSVAQKHEIMRTTFPINEGQPVQYVHDNAEFDVSTFDLQDRPYSQRVAEGETLARQQARKPFDLDRGPLTRITLIRFSEQDHLMLITMHHMITDQWSMEILHRELSSAYQQLIDGRDIAQATHLQYGDFAFWQRSQEVNKEHLAYWKEKLAGELPMLKLPFDHPRPVRPTFRGGLMKRSFNRTLSDKLKTLARDNNTTSFVLLLSAFKVLLHRYAHQNDILIGTPFSNREKVSLENVLGFFNDTLVLRSDLSGNPSFMDVLQQVRKSVLDAFSYKTIPFETLVKTLAPERDLASNPIFQVMFLYHKANAKTSFAPDLREEHGPFDLGVSKFDLTLYVSEGEENFSAIFEYTLDLFESETIERMHGHLARLLEEIVSAPNAAISSFTILTDEERQQQLIEWNATEEPTALLFSPVHELINRQALAKPQSTAVIFKNRHITYQELNDKAETICGDLLSCGVRRGAVVGICAYRSTEFVASILGILKAGAAYLPLDPEYPAERLRFMVEDAKLKVIIADAKARKIFQDTTVRIYDVHKGFGETDHREAGKATPVQADDLAYIIYTSGSTGKPKGVQVTHANLAHSTLARNSFYPEPPSAFLLLSSFSFDSSVAGIFWTLCNGGTLVLAEEHIEQDMHQLANRVAAHMITHTLLLPFLYAVMLQHASTEMLKSLRTVIVAGEACSSSICRRHFETLPEAALYNEYGPTEATVWCTAHKITEKDIAGPVPIGKPIANTQVYILDEHLQPVPIGVAGELFIGGAGITRGYLNQEELTLRSFVSDPFHDQTQRLYRTGDLCRYRNNGVIEYLGRADQQVKIRGYRIELDEIREALLDTPGVRDSEVVIVNENPESSEKVGERDRLVELLGSLDPDEAERILQIIETLPDQDYAEQLIDNENQQAFTA